MTKLSIKQQKFVDAYVELGNATKAAIKAGYSKHYAGQNAGKLLKNPKVVAAINERMEQIASKKIAKQTEVMEYLTQVLRGEATETLVVSTPEGAVEVDNSPNIKDRMAAGREIMKRYPGDDKVSEAELQKLKADARKAEAEATIIEAKASAYKTPEGSKGGLTKLLAAIDSTVEGESHD